MPIPIKVTTLVSASAVAASSQTVTDPDAYWIHRFWITISNAANVQVQGSGDGVTWVDLLAADVTATGVAIVDRPYRYLRAEWAGNTGTVTVVLEQFGGDALAVL